MPVLLLRRESLVKTTRFGKFTYVGDPCNTVRIFNELEVDELVFLDIMATREDKAPNLAVLTDIANECFMPLAYGGGIREVEVAKAIHKIGFEKIIVNTAAVKDPGLVQRLASQFGSQAVVVSIDVKSDLFGKQRVFINAGKKNTGRDPLEWASEVQAMGAGEILLTSIDREGSWTGFDNELVRRVTETVDIPVIANGGAGCVEHIGDVVNHAGASAVGLGSMVVFQKKGMGVLVNFPDRDELAGAII